MFKYLTRSQIKEVTSIHTAIYYDINFIAKS